MDGVPLVCPVGDKLVCGHRASPVPYSNGVRLLFAVHLGYTRPDVRTDKVRRAVRRACFRVRLCQPCT